MDWNSLMSSRLRVTPVAVPMELWCLLLFHDNNCTLFVTFGYLWALFVRMCGTIDPGIHTMSTWFWHKNRVWQPTTNLWPTDHAWPPLNPYFRAPLHLNPIMLTPLTKSIKSKENSFHPFPKFFLFIYFFEIFRFYIMQWWNKHDVEKE
jgi:hypothetical protein